jgi:long-chain fatty acid transport protein
MKKYLQASLAVLLSLCMGSDAFAVGGSFISNEVVSARAAGQGYVGVAGQNNDPTAVFTNPGAMTSLKGTQVTFGAHLENIRGAYEDPAGTETKARMTNVVVPNVSVTQSFMDGKLSAGLSVQSPFGLETHWDANSPMRYVATNSRIGMVDITPAVAYQVHPKVSIGAGVDYYNMFKAQLDRQVYVDGVNGVTLAGLGGTFSGAPDATSSLQGQAASWGYHAGLVYQPSEQHAIGITYHSKVDLRVNGNVTIRGMSGAMASPLVFGGSDFTASAYTDVMLPSNVQFGYAYKPNEKWMLEADTAWYHWSSGRDINVRYPNVTATQLALLSANNPQPLTARDAWSFATGANYKASDKWQFRGGFWYEPWALPESTFSPALMDLSRYGISTGLGYAITENWGVDFAYTAVFMHNRTINNQVHENTTGMADGTPLPSGVTGADGTYKNFANLLALNFTYRFGASK